MILTTYDEWFHQNIKDQLGNISYEWNETNVDLITSELTEEQIIQETIDFFMSIDAPHLREGSVRKLFNAGYTSVEQIIAMTKDDLETVIGANGIKIYNGLKIKLDMIPLNVLMGSTNFFGRGLGKRKFKKLIDAVGWEIVFHGNISDFAGVDGFDIKTARKIVYGMDDFLKFADLLETADLVTIDYMDNDETVDSAITGMKFCFTGFRDKEAQARIETLGGSVGSSVSKNTNFVVTTNPDGTSGKLKKAREIGIKIISPAQLQDMLK